MAAMALTLLTGTVGPPQQAGHRSADHPVLIITAERKQAWAALAASHHPWIGLAASNCLRTGTPQQAYGDDGFWCGLMWVFNDDRDAAARATALLLSAGNAPANANDERQNCGARVILTSWLYPAMSDEERDSALAELNGWVRWGVKGTGKAYEGGYRLEDGDQSSATYLCAAMLDRFAGTSWLDSSMSAKGVGGPFLLGGLGSKAPGRASLEHWATMCAAGGEWSESTEYNPNTTMLVAMGYEALRSTGPDSLPMLRRCLEQAAERSPWEVTPDLAQGVQWGDEEHPRGFMERLYERINSVGMLAGITRNAAAQGLVARLVAKYGATGYGTADPGLNGGWMLAFYDESIPVDSAPRSGAWYAPGRGHVWAHHEGSLFFGEAQPPTNEDHQVGYVFGHQLYRNGEWVIQNPVGYGAPFNLALATNGLSLAGFGTMARKTFERFDSTGIACVTGSTGGSLYGGDYYDPPPPFVQIARRTTCYLQSEGTDIIITHDSVVMSKPGRRDRYYPAELARLDTTGGWFAIWHPTSIPERSGDTWSWRTAGGQSVWLTAFGGTVRDAVVDEHELWPEVTRNPTLGFQLRLTPSGQTLTTVIVVGDSLPVSRNGSTVVVGRNRVTFGPGRVTVERGT